MAIALATYQIADFEKRMPGFKPIDRRELLRGAGGVAMGLPLLEAMASTRDEITSPKRMVASGIYYGLVPEHFHPKKIGVLRYGQALCSVFSRIFR